MLLYCCTFDNVCTCIQMSEQMACKCAYNHILRHRQTSTCHRSDACHHSGFKECIYLTASFNIACHRWWPLKETTCCLLSASGLQTWCCSFCQQPVVPHFCSETCIWLGLRPYFPDNDCTCALARGKVCLTMLICFCNTHQKLSNHVWRMILCPSTQRCLHGPLWADTGATDCIQTCADAGYSVPQVPVSSSNADVFGILVKIKTPNQGCANHLTLSMLQTVLTSFTCKPTQGHIRPKLPCPAHTCLGFLGIQLIMWGLHQVQMWDFECQRCIHFASANYQDICWECNQALAHR